MKPSFNLPIKQGLYDPKHEHDACGIGFIANFRGEISHQMIQQGLSMLCRLEHRGGNGSDPDTGDGAGVMIQIPHKFFQRECSQLNKLKEGTYAVGMIFLPQNSELRSCCEEVLQQFIEEEGQTILGWRTVPTDDTTIGAAAKQTQPFIRQVFIAKSKNEADGLEFERKLFRIRKRAEKVIREQQLAQNETFYVVSLSSKTIVYKGLLTPKQLGEYYLDLQDETAESAFAMVHSRYSTNTFPSWERAHPNRYLVHNGEINTLQGNVNWMSAREKMIEYSDLGAGSAELLPIIEKTGSDSASFDNVLEFLTLTGRPLAHTAMMMVPAAWEHDETMADDVKAFYEFHSHLMEPWDGPAALAFTDGKQIGAMLDRNGLRPARYYITDDDTIILSSEAGVLDIDSETIIEKGRLSPGTILLVDLQKGRIIKDKEVKQQLASRLPYRKWLNEQSISIHDLPDVTNIEDINDISLSQFQRAFGYTTEEVMNQIMPMAVDGKDPIGSMGSDTPLAVLSNRPQLLYNYFKQLFAQVTNPPIDAIREPFVTSTFSYLGAEGNFLHPDAESCRRIRLETPILTNQELAKIRNSNMKFFQSKTFPIVFPADKEKGNLEDAMQELFQKVEAAIANGVSIIILSDQQVNKEFAPIPVLLAISGLHHSLVRNGTRTQVSIIVETGEARDVHQICTLLGYGADAINPYLAFSTIEELVMDGQIKEMTSPEAIQTYIQAVTGGVVKVLSKMGISTVQSYRGAQIFEAVGIHSTVIDQYFTGTTSQLEGIRLDTIADETLLRHQQAFQTEEGLEAGSEFQWRKGGEVHAFQPQTIHLLKQACRKNDYQMYKKYAEKANKEQLIFIRNMFDFRETTPIPLEEVESVESICRRFKTGAMSYGSLSQEAHETLAIAMNRIGGKSNSGEGGEHPDRYIPDENGDLRRSAIKQVASGRFGVSSHYLVNADEIQIKMAQGAKPGEGGQIPGSKVYPWIAEVRGSTPGVSLISPPPHHDIYSIEDLAQLIYDLKNANPKARISVKLVAKSGVGTIAAGVAKGLADVILISGADGGTGAAPRTSIKHAGLPWELGLAETHQTLMLNGLRDRVVLEADGKLMTGRDVVLASLLGAEEYGFATAALVVLGCVLIRACHLNTCPVGIATQDPELRKKFLGDPEHVVNFMRFIAQDVRELMAELGFRTIDEMVGRSDLLKQSKQALSHWKAKDLDLSPLLYQPENAIKGQMFNQRTQDHGLEKSLDCKKLLEVCQPALTKKKPVKASFSIQNIHRTVGTILGSEVTKRYGREGLPEDTIQLEFTGTAGQSFGSFLPKGITLMLKGDANDYVGKGLSGGKIIVSPSDKYTFGFVENSYIGNVAFYGATSGEAYIRGQAGERFCVRNSGIHAVVEGIGDHGCEYMTGGRVVVLGPVGKNFAAGMSGGTAYVFTEDEKTLKTQCNQEFIDFEIVDDSHERNEVKQLLMKHFQHTGSLKALKILRQWDHTISNCVKIIPKEYKRIMQAGGMSH
ncbi:glutamate synthase large subunit [Neobacillus kokaensis]|uniref:Glutamate synthase [NADPH] large chain n=1 Tax=Neobacillus kokaensis TaxID=2759023 RepID=A0ABQ3N8N4_9BACI|nr:glutamate synthase large subunit [Neobacillus kokaensis]GHH98935.1 glutamate synthase [NADPH] large chain [Neobacillus kokaensis]